MFQNFLSPRSNPKKLAEFPENEKIAKKTETKSFVERSIKPETELCNQVPENTY